MNTSTKIFVPAVLLFLALRGSTQQAKAQYFPNPSQERRPDNGNAFCIAAAENYGAGFISATRINDGWVCYFRTASFQIDNWGNRRVTSKRSNSLRMRLPR